MVWSETEESANSFIFLGFIPQKCIGTNSSLSTWGLVNSVGLFVCLKLSSLYLRATVMPYIGLSASILNIVHWSYCWNLATKIVPVVFNGFLTKAPGNLFKIIFSCLTLCCFVLMNPHVYAGLVRTQFLLNLEV